MFSSTIFRVTNDKGEKHLTYRLQLEPLLQCRGVGYCWVLAGVSVYGHLDCSIYQMSSVLIHELHATDAFDALGNSSVVTIQSRF